MRPRLSSAKRSQEGAGQVSDLFVANVELILHERLNGKQHIPICIVEQVQRGQKNQRRLGLKLVLVHGNLVHREQEYTMCVKSFRVACSASALASGQSQL